MGLGNPTSLPGRVAARDLIPVPRVQHRKAPPMHILAAESKFDDVRCARWASAARVPFDCWLRSSFRMTGAPAGLAALPLRTIMVSLGPFLTHMCSRISPRCRRIMGGFKSKASTLPSRTCLSSSSIVAPELARAFAAIASPLAAILCTVSTASRPHSLSLLRRRLRCGCLLRRRLLRQGGPRGGPAHLPREHDHPAERARARGPPHWREAPIGLGELITSWVEPFRCLACSTERLRQRIWPPQRAFRFGAPLSRRSTPSSRDGVE